MPCAIWTGQSYTTVVLKKDVHKNMELIYVTMRTRMATALFPLIQMEQEEQLLQAQDLLLQVNVNFCQFFIISDIMKIIKAPCTAILQVHVYMKPNPTFSSLF